MYVDMTNHACMTTCHQLPVDKIFSSVIVHVSFMNKRFKVASNGDLFFDPPRCANLVLVGLLTTLFLKKLVVIYVVM